MPSHDGQHIAPSAPKMYVRITQKLYHRVACEWLLCSLLLPALLLLDAVGPRYVFDMDSPQVLPTKPDGSQTPEYRGEISDPWNRPKCPSCPTVSCPEQAQSETPIVKELREGLMQCNEDLRRLELTPPSKNCPACPACPTCPDTLRSTKTTEDIAQIVKAVFFGAGATILLIWCRGNAASSHTPAAAESMAAADVNALEANESQSRSILASSMLSSLEMLWTHQREWMAEHRILMDSSPRAPLAGADAKPSVVPPINLTTPPRFPPDGQHRFVSGVHLGVRGIIPNVSDVLWARNTPPNSARSVSPLTNSSFGSPPAGASQWVGRPSSISTWLAHQQAPTSVTTTVNGGADIGLPKDSHRASDVAHLSKVLCSLYQAYMLDADQHWYARADALYADGRTAIKTAVQVKRAHEAKAREVEELRRQLDVSSSAWSAKVNEMRSDAETKRSAQEKRHAENLEDAHRRLCEWESRFATMSVERHELSASLMEAKLSIAQLLQAKDERDRDVERLQTTLDHANALVERHTVEQAERLPQSVGVQCCPPTHTRSTSATDVTEFNQATPTARLPDGMRLMRQEVAALSGERVASALQEALLRENREKHLARLEARLLELDQRHHAHQYNPMTDAHPLRDQDRRMADSPANVSCSSTATTGSEADPLNPVSHASRPVRSRQSPSDAYSHSVMRAHEEASAQRDKNALFDALSLHHSGVSRRPSTNSRGLGAPHSGMDGWLQQHPYATGKENKVRTPK